MRSATQRTRSAAHHVTYPNPTQPNPIPPPPPPPPHSFFPPRPHFSYPTHPLEIERMCMKEEEAEAEDSSFVSFVSFVSKWVN